MIRAFVALPIPEHLHPGLEAAQAGLRIGRIVPPENFHITLAFLGSQSDSVLQDVHDGLNGLSTPEFDIELEGLGTFGKARPRALFAEVVPCKPLSALRKKIRQAAADAGLVLEHKRFHPHVTLARFGAGLHPDEAGELHGHIARSMSRANCSFSVTGFTLFQSELGQGAPAYTPLAEYPVFDGR